MLNPPASPWRGSVPDQYGLHSAGSAGGAAETLTASFLHPQSRYRGDAEVLERIRLAAGLVCRSCDRKLHAHDAQQIDRTGRCIRFICQNCHRELIALEHVKGDADDND